MDLPLLSESKEKYYVIARLDPIGPTAVNGLSKRYDDTFPQIFKESIPEKEFQIAINAINQILQDYFPCLYCRALGYICCTVTCGTSLYCINPCTHETEENLRKVLQRINNRDIFLTKGITWELKHERWISWIEISQPQV